MSWQDKIRKSKKAKEQYERILDLYTPLKILNGDFSGPMYDDPQVLTNEEYRQIIGILAKASQRARGMMSD